MVRRIYSDHDLLGSCYNRHETWTALLGRGPGVDRGPSALLVAWGMRGEPEGIPNTLQSARATLSDVL